MKKSKLMRILAIVFAISLLSAALLTGCGKNTGNTGNTGNNGPKGNGNDLGVALITSAAGANDNGYNQSAIKGLEKAKNDFGINYKVVESTDIPGSLEQLAGAGYKLIFSLEYNFDALINGVGGSKPIAEKYPDTTFVVFNDNPNVNEDGSVKHKNVISVMFDVHEASFLAGALSVLVNENASELFDSADYNFTPGDQGRKIGFIGGTKSNGITVFSYGFAEGINYEAQKLGVKYTYYSDYNAGFTDSAAGATKAATYYADGANIVYAVAGSVGDGVDAKAKEVKKLSIEVDANKDNNQPGYVLTSVLKNTEVPVYKIIEAYKNNTIGELQGKVLSYDLASGATGITDLSVISSKIKSQEKWNEILAELDDISKKIGSGEIKVTNAQAGESFDKTRLTNLDMPND
jgi:nucleoside-binding protein